MGLFDQGFRRRERALEGRQGHLAEQVDDRDAVVDRQAAPRRLRREVGRTEDAVGPGQVRREVALAPHPVAQRDHVGACGQQPFGDLGGDASPVGGVFAVHDAEIGAKLLAQPAQMRFDCPAPRCAEHVRNEEDPHCALRKLRLQIADADGRPGKAGTT